MHHSSEHKRSGVLRFSSSLPTNVKQREEREEPAFLSSIDELPDFYDPYSDLNLFLVQKIKKEISHFGSFKKWSLKIQEELLKKIAPEFQQKFPHYRLGISALKKIWEKISYYSQQIQQQKEAITQDGKLNIHFFIKENLKQLTSLKTLSHFHPSHFAHQLGMKMSECIATIDGERPKLEHLTKLIWSIQRHLLCGTHPEQLKSPYDEYDKIDQLIVKIILELTARDPRIGHNELQHKVHEILHSLRELPSFTSIDSLAGNVSALLSEKLYPSSAFHDLLLSGQKTALISFIRRHSSLCKTSIAPQPLTELVRRIHALYTLASGLPKTLTEQDIKSATLAVYPVDQSQRPLLPQSLYAFISAELVLMRKEEFSDSCAHIEESIWSAYKEAIQLPELKSTEHDLLDIAIWKTISESEGLLEKLPYNIGQRIEEEIANILIDNPKQNFCSLVHSTVQFFKRTKELVDIKKWQDIERKIHAWVIQRDMVCRWIRLDLESPLLRLICKKRQETPCHTSHQIFVSEICQEYLKQHPELTIYAGQLSQRVWILYKYAWYALFSSKEESSYERFLKWHASSLLFNSYSKEHCIEKLEELVKQTLPLIPFDAQHCRAIVLSLVA